MKKSGFIILFVCMILVLCGCNQDKSVILYNNISEYCEEYFVGETQDYYIELFDGEREEPYYLDGISENKQRYCLIVVTPRQGIEVREDMEYCIELNGDTIEGGLDISPFDDTLSADVQLELTSEDNIFVYIKLDTSTQVSKMKCISQAFTLNWQNVINSTYEKIANDVDVLLAAHKSMECYVQVINKNLQVDKYYWCVTIIFDNGDKYAVIVDTNTGEILAKNL